MSQPRHADITGRGCCIAWQAQHPSRNISGDRRLVLRGRIQPVNLRSVAIGVIEGPCAHPRPNAPTAISCPPSTPTLRVAASPSAKLPCSGFIRKVGQISVLFQAGIADGFKRLRRAGFRFVGTGCRAAQLYQPLRRGAGIGVIAGFLMRGNRVGNIVFVASTVSPPAIT